MGLCLPAPQKDGRRSVGCRVQAEFSQTGAVVTPPGRHQISAIDPRTAIAATGKTTGFDRRPPCFVVRIEVTWGNSRP
jgi:hypothetical protein